MKSFFAPEATSDFAMSAVSSPSAVHLSPSTVLLLLATVLICSLLCLMAAMRKGGEALKRPLPLLLCQIYIALCGFYCLGAAAGSLVRMVEGVLLLVLGFLPIFFCQRNFRIARCCIGMGAVLAAIAMLL